MREVEAIDDYQLLAEAIPHIIWIAGSDGRAEYFNAQWFAYTGLSYGQAAGDGWQQAVHPDDLAPALHERATTLSNGELFEAEFRIRGADAEYRWFLVRSVPMRDSSGEIVRWFGSCTDINEQKRAESMLVFFARAGGALSESLEPAVLGATFARLLVPEFADYCQLFTIDEHRLTLLASAYLNSAQGGFMEAALTGNLTFESVERAGRGFGATRVPLIARGQQIGLMLTGFSISGRRGQALERPLLEESARRLALALDNARRYQHEHGVATALQRAMLPPRLPQIDGARFTSLYIPAASELQIGGDWFDAFVLENGLVGISIGDVTGHGLEAAILMGEVRQAIRSAAIEANPPSKVLDHADRVLSMNHPEAIATAGFAIYDPSDRTLSYASAGHPPPLVARADGTILEVSVDGLPLGLRSAGPCGSTSVSLDPGTLVCFYTDGLIEFDRNAIEGERRLREALAEQAMTPSEQPATALYERVVAGGPNGDDTAILVVQVE